MMLRGGSRAYAPAAASRASSSASASASAAASAVAAAAALRRRRRPARPAAAAAAAAASAAADAAATSSSASPPPPHPAAALALTAPAFVRTPGATTDPAVRPPRVRGRRQPVHPFDAAAMAIGAAANRAAGLPLATALDRHPAAVLLLCLAAGALASLGVGAASSTSALVALDPSAAAPAWARAAVTLASETGGAAELPWMGLAAAAVALPLAAWALARPWWLGSTDACYALVQRMFGARGGGAGEAAALSDGGSGGRLRLLLAWGLSAARLALLPRAAEACGAAWRAAAAGGVGVGGCSPVALAAAVLLAALAVAPVVAAAVGLPSASSSSAKRADESSGDKSSSSTTSSSSNDNNTESSSSSARAPALALLSLELSWLVLRAAQAASAPTATPAPLAAALGAALALSLWLVHARSVRPRVDVARARKGDAVRVHVTARLAWDSNGYGAGAAFDGTGRRGLGRDMDDPDQEGVPIVVKLGSLVVGDEGHAASPSLDERAGGLLLPDDEAERLAAGRVPATAGGRLAGFGPALARALVGALPGERVVVRARIAGPDDALIEERTRRWGAVRRRRRRQRPQGAAGKDGGEAAAVAAAGAAEEEEEVPHPDDAPVRYFHPGLEALLTLPEARVLVFGRDAARGDPLLQPGDGLLLPVGGDGTAPRGAFAALDGEVGATGRVPGVVVEVGRSGVRASGNAVLAGRRVELEARVETVLRGEDPRRPTMLV